MARENPAQPLPEITPEDAARLAEAIKKIDKGIRLMADAGLNRRAIITLLNDLTGVNKRDINDVLNGLEGLGEAFLEKQKK